MAAVVQFRLVDAFADAPFTGNPAGVVLDADGLSEAQMRAIAREINASETAFLAGGNDLHRPTRLRWFTPRAEVQFCGHATLAAAHAAAEAGGRGGLIPVTGDDVVFDTAAGPLRLRVERTPAGAMWWLVMPDPALRPDSTNPIRTGELLGLAAEDLDPAVPVMRTRDNDLILLVKSWRRLFEIRPRLDELAEWSLRHQIRGFCVATRATLSPQVHVHSRFFAPAVGVAEDPVTGSVHGPLAALLVAHGLVPLSGRRAVLRCAQGEPGGRTGLVHALVEATADGYRVSIGGRCETTLRGELRVPPQE